MNAEPDQTNAEFASLRKVARSVLRCTADADDVVQRAWIEAAQSRSATIDNRQGWLGGIVRTLARSEFRDRARRRKREQESARPEATYSDPSAEISQAETIDAVRTAVGNLNEPQRSAIRLHCFEGVSTIEIAKRLDVSQATVQYYLRKANESLRTQLRALYENSDRALGMVLIGSFPWEKSDLEEVAFAAKAGGASLGIAAVSKWLVAALVLVASLVATVRFRSQDAREQRVSGVQQSAELADLDPNADAQLTLISSAVADGAREQLIDSAEASEALGAPSESALGANPSAATAGVGSTLQELLVVDPTGVPVVGAEIFSPAQGSDVPLGSTDSDGLARVDFKGLVGTRLMRNSDAPYVRVFARSPEYADTYCYVFRQELVDRPRVTMPFLDAPMRIAGRVLRPDGRPVVGALVERNSIARQADRIDTEVRIDENGNSYEYRRFQALTDTRGEFVLTGLPRALHTLEVTADGFATATKAISAKGDTSIDCTIELIAAGTVVGTVLGIDGTPAVGARVYVAPTMASKVEPILVHTDSQGRFRAEGVMAAPTRVLTGVIDARASTLIKVSPGEEIAVELQMVKLQRFQVRVVDEEGMPMEGYAVLGQTVSQNWASERRLTDEDGIALIVEFPSEPLVVLVFRPRSPIHLAKLRVEEPIDGGEVEIVSPREHASIGVASGLVRLGEAIPPPGSSISARVFGLAHRRTVTVAPASGAFRLDKLPAGKYQLSMDTPDKMRVPLGTFELDGVDADLGTLTTPPMGTLLIDWRWSDDDAGSYRLRQIYSNPGEARVSIHTIAEGAGPPLAELDVVPGAYGMIVYGLDGESIQQQTVVVRPGARQRLISSPEPLVNAIVDLELIGAAPESLPVRVYAVATEDDAAFDALDADALALHATSANLRYEEVAEEGWNGAFLVPIAMDTTHRWILEAEWPEGQVHHVPLARAQHRALTAMAFELSADGWKKSSELGKQGE